MPKPFLNLMSLILTMYKLLPFTFSRISSKEVLVNEIGDMLAVPEGTVERIIDKKIDTKGDLYKSLVAAFFLTERSIPSLIDVYSERLAEKKRFMDDGTALHIFVLTLRCNQNCIYCQASSCGERCENKSMSMETMEYAVHLMFKSPSEWLTMEFQGGEPTLEPELLRYGIELAEKLNKKEQRHIRYVLCTNSICLTSDVLDLCKMHDVYISTSLDGPAWLHNKNRGKTNSHDKVTNGISKAREILGEDKVSALMTTSELALDYPEDIVDEYVKLGFHSVFIRALNPYGLACVNKNWELYTEKFIEFYKQAFEHILSVNKSGYHIVEDYAAIILRKILTPWCTGFVDLQSPAGIVNSVLVYNYDGYLYASDESRMLAEIGDYSFRIGSVKESYESLMSSAKVKLWAKVWSNEAMAGCSDCGLRVYCGADPVRNHSTQGDIYGFRPSSLFCKKNKAIIEYIISLLIEREQEVMPIFKSWIR